MKIDFRYGLILLLYNDISNKEHTKLTICDRHDLKEVDK